MHAFAIGYLQVLCLFAAHHGLIAGSKVVDNQCLFITDDQRLKEVPFDNVTQICCEKGVEYKIQNGKEIECCGGKRKFQPSTEVCCNDTVYLKNSMKDYRICMKDNVLGNNDFSPKDQSYTLNTNVCCGNIVQKRLILNLPERWLKNLGRLQPINFHIIGIVTNPSLNVRSCPIFGGSYKCGLCTVALDDAFLVKHSLVNDLST